MIITPKYGRLCNRLLLGANAICHVAKYGGSYLQLGFEEYAHLFQTTAKHGILFYKSHKKRPWRVRIPFDYLDTSELTDLLSILNGYGPRTDMSGKKFRRIEKRTEVLFARGWNYRDPLAVQEFGDVARSFFTPTDDIAKKVSALMQRIDDRGKKALIGVHIRQTDYATFKNGEYFLSAATYRKCMETVAKLFSKKVAFIIASDAPIAFKEFEGLEWYPAPNHITADNLALSKCDYIIGVPSTYSGWASFYGKTPIFQITNGVFPKSLNDFSIYNIS